MTNSGLAVGSNRPRGASAQRRSSHCEASAISTAGVQKQVDRGRVPDGHGYSRTSFSAASGETGLRHLPIWVVSAFPTLSIDKCEKLAIRIVYVGELQLKNIAGPVRVYRVRVAGPWPKRG
jgi:hypothetical protein